ncbi:SH3 domain protein, partial [Rhizoctonia solani 123E]
MKFTSPLPVSLPKECEKATKILLSFVDGRNDGLDGLIPRQILEQAQGFAIFTVVKAGFLFSARAGSGLVISRLHDGTWTAPSAIGTAGMGVGGQAGAEMTDFLIVLNTRAAVKSFMSAGSLTLGGNMSLAVGPIGRNGAADVALNTKGKVAAMYSYSRTKGLFGGISVEGSIIVERQDANALAYDADVTSKQLLSGVVPTPPWAQNLVRALERCTGLPTGQKWIQEDRTGSDVSGGYHFGGVGASSSQSSPRGGIIDRTKRMSGVFSPP